MTKGTSPKAKIRDLRRLLDRKGHLLSAEARQDIAAKIAEYEGTAPKPPKVKRKGGEKKTEAGGSQLLKIESEVFQLRQKLVQVKGMSQVDQKKVQRIEEELKKKNLTYSQLKKEAQNAQEAKHKADKEKRKAEKKAAKKDRSNEGGSAGVQLIVDGEEEDVGGVSESAVEPEAFPKKSKRSAFESTKDVDEVPSGPVDLTSTFFDMVEGDDPVVETPVVRAASKVNRKGDKRAPKPMHKGTRTKHHQRS